MVKRYAIEIAGPVGVAIPTRGFGRSISQDDLKNIAALVDDACGSKPRPSGAMMNQSISGGYTTPGNNRFYIEGVNRDRVSVHTSSPSYSDSDLQKKLQKYDGLKRW